MLSQCALSAGASNQLFTAVNLRTGRLPGRVVPFPGQAVCPMLQAAEVRLKPPEQITSPLVRELSAYWDRVRAGRLAPSWPEIDPGAIKSCLPYLLVSEVFGEPFDLRVRLAGTEIVESYGYDPTGMTLRGFPHPPADGAWLPLYVKVIEEKRPVFGRYVAEIGRDAIFRVDAVTLPLSQDGRSVDRMIEVEDWRMAPGVRRGQIDPAAWRFEMLDWPAT